MICAGTVFSGKTSCTRTVRLKLLIFFARAASTIKGAGLVTMKTFSPFLTLKISLKKIERLSERNLNDLLIRLFLF